MTRGSSNMSESLKQVIMRRDDMSSEEADELINEAKEELAEGGDPEEILAEYFGLELDYIMDLF